MLEVFNETKYDLTKDIKELEELMIYALEYEKLKDVSFNIILVDNKKIKEINKDYRNIDKETDVITFALEDDKTDFKLPERILGDIYISIDKAKSQAIEYGHSFKRELSFLAIHGFYHLLGYDHMNLEDEKVMFNKQEEVLTGYGIIR